MDAIEYGFNAEADTMPCVTKNLDRAANISDWVEPYLGPTPNVTQFRQFKIEMIQGVVSISARSRCAEDAEFNPWLNLNQVRGYSPVLGELVQNAFIMNVL